jgi:hypothetical protein
MAMKQEILRQARLDLVYYGAVPAVRGVECRFRVNRSGVVLDAPCLALRAHGFRVGTGHFMLMASNGTIGSLHRYPGGRAFEGRWERSGECGFWRVYSPG